MAKLTITKLATGMATEGGAIQAAKVMASCEAVAKGVSKHARMDFTVLNTGLYGNRGWTAKVRLIVERES